MAQKIKQGNIFGRIGTGIGKGLAQQFPEELQRARLAQGLSNFEQESGELNPTQQLARLSAIPGITPQMIQSFSELAKYNRQAKAYANAGQKAPVGAMPSPRSSPDLAQVQNANVMDQMQNAGQQMQQSPMPSRGMAPQAMMEAAPQRQGIIPKSGETTADVISEPPLSERGFTRSPWTPEQMDNVTLQYMERGFLPDESRQLAKEAEQRYLSEPEAVKTRRGEEFALKERVSQKLENQLKSRLEKSGEAIYGDISGEVIERLKRGAHEDLINHPNMSEDQIVNKWSHIATELAKTKGTLEKLAKTDFAEGFYKPKETFGRLETAAKIFANAGTSEDFYNYLQRKKDDGGYGLSPHGAAYVAFKPSPDLEKTLKSIRSSQKGSIEHVNTEKNEINSRRAANEVLKNLGDNDSILAVMNYLRLGNIPIDQQIFIDQLRQNVDSSRLNERQKREILEGTKDLTPNWGDIQYLPWSLK